MLLVPNPSGGEPDHELASPARFSSLPKPRYRAPRPLPLAAMFEPCALGHPMSSTLWDAELDYQPEWHDLYDAPRVATQISDMGHHPGGALGLSEPSAKGLGAWRSGIEDS